jgi:hypothetical protein
MSSLGARHRSGVNSALSGAIIFEAGYDARDRAKVTSPEESRAPSREEHTCSS